VGTQSFENIIAISPLACIRSLSKKSADDAMVALNGLAAF